MSELGARLASDSSHRKKTWGGPFIPPHGSTFLSVRAIAFGESTRAEIRHIPYGANALIARIGRLPISARSGRQRSRAKRFSVAYVRHRQPTSIGLRLQGLPEIISCAKRACGVHDTVFRKSGDLSALIDRARQPVISA